MKLKFFQHRALNIFLGIAILFSGLVLSFHKVDAATGDIQFGVIREGDSADVVGATVLFRCAGGTFTALTGNPTTNGSGIVHAAPQAGSNCSNGNIIDAQVSANGYVTTTYPSINTYNSGIDNIYGFGSIKFAFKLVVADELGNSVVPTVATLRGSSYDLAVGNTFYWADSFASGAALVVQKDGYVSSDTVNPEGVSTNPNTQVVITYGSGSICSGGVITSSTSCKGLQFSNKVTGITDELLNPLTSGLTVKTGNSFGTTCVANSGAWYCAVPLADTSTAISVAKDGYVTNTATSFTADRTTATDPQQTQSVSGVKYALKITAANAVNVPITGATVTAGDNFGVTCTESGSTGVYYCAIPLAQTGTTAKIIAASYDAQTGTYSDRTVDTDPQSLLSLAPSVTASGAAPVWNTPATPPTVPSSASTPSSRIVAASGTTVTPTISSNTPPTTPTPVVITNPSPTPAASTPYVFTENVTAHSSKAVIMQLQKTLNFSLASGLKKPLVVDGTFGSHTFSAVIQFQKSHNISATGVVGPKTRVALDLVVITQ